MKMKKQMKSDLPLKVFSVMIAICLWFYVVQVQSPDMDRVIKGVPVVFTQKNILEEKNLIVLNDNEHTIDIKIRGSRKYVMEVSSEQHRIHRPPHCVYQHCAALCQFRGY